MVLPCHNWHRALFVTFDQVISLFSIRNVVVLPCQYRVVPLPVVVVPMMAVVRWRRWGGETGEGGVRIAKAYPAEVNEMKLTAVRQFLNIVYGGRAHGLFVLLFKLFQDMRTGFQRYKQSSTPGSVFQQSVR